MQLDFSVVRRSTTDVNGLELIGIGSGVGLLYGVFGAGGSAFATPLLALAGVPPIIAVASPLPATIPAGLAGAWNYRRQGAVATKLATRAVAIGAPMAILGALCSDAVPGTFLLVLSTVVLLLLGVRLTLPVDERVQYPAHRVATTVAVAGAGFAAGLLANSGGFLLVPVFLLVAGLGMRTASGTSMLVAASLTVPTLVTHWALGHVDWAIAETFGLGLVPGTILGSRVVHRLPTAAAQRSFGAVLLLFGAWYLLRLS
jgi:uncharacterized membrane protein YfcA